jgi:subtilisin family serine protease
MAGLIAGHGGGTMRVLGIAPETKILPVSVGPGNSGVAADDLADAIRWSADHGAQVINVSISGPPAGSPMLDDAVDYALSKDVVVVAAAGNASDPGKAVGSPASKPGVIAVSGADRNARFWTGSSRGPQIVIAAPAVRIVSPSPRWVSATGLSIADGTSPATAIVSGVAALVRSQFPNMDAANVVNRLIRTAKDQGVPGRDPLYGFGTVRPLDALTLTVPSVSRNPLLPPGDSLTPAPPVAAGSSTGVGVGELLVWGGVALLVLVVAVVLMVVLIVRSRRPVGPYPRSFRGGPPGNGPIGHGPPYPPGFGAPRQRSCGGAPPGYPPQQGPPGSAPR